MNADDEPAVIGQIPAAERNRAYVRQLLLRREPAFAAALAYAEQYFSCSACSACPVTGQVAESVLVDQAAAGIQGWPLASMTRTSKTPRPCLAAVDR
jgi:hypothetical protein